jgi:hypothetical protein
VTTLDTLVERTRSRLNAGARDRLNVLAAGIDSDDTTITVTYDPDVNLTAGTVIELGYEQLMVLAVSDTTLTVQRAWGTTTAAAHDADELISIEPRFTRASILDALIGELRTLPQGIFAVDSVEVTFPAYTNTVEFPVTSPDVYRVLDAVRVDTVDEVLRRPRLRLIRDADPSTYGAGYAIALSDGTVYTMATTVRVTYAAQLATLDLDATSDLVDDVGVGVAVVDALVYLAGASLLMDKEVLRYDTSRQGQSRDAAEVPADALGKLAQRWRDEGLRRVSSEQVRLLELYGWSQP